MDRYNGQIVKKCCKTCFYHAKKRVCKIIQRLDDLGIFSPEEFCCNQYTPAEPNDTEVTKKLETNKSDTEVRPIEELNNDTCEKALTLSEVLGNMHDKINELIDAVNSINQAIKNKEATNG